MKKTVDRISKQMEMILKYLSSKERAKCSEIILHIYYEGDLYSMRRAPTKERTVHRVSIFRSMRRLEQMGFVEKEIFEYAHLPISACLCIY